MTTLDHRPTPADTIDGEVLDTTVHPIPANPHRFGVKASALIVVGAAVGLATQLDATATNAALAGGALSTAVGLYLHKLTRFNTFAEANDPFARP